MEKCVVRTNGQMKKKRRIENKSIPIFHFSRSTTMSWTSLSNDDFTGYVLNMALVWKPYGDTERTISLQVSIL